MIPRKNGFHSGSKPDRRKLLASVTRYIDDNELRQFVQDFFFLITKGGAL